MPANFGLAHEKGPQDDTLSDFISYRMLSIDAIDSKTSHWELTARKLEDENKKKSAKIRDLELQLREKDEQMVRMKECKICLEKEKNITLLPCGHIMCCSDCSSKMKTCPICRTDIEARKRSYIDWE